LNYVVKITPYSAMHEMWRLVIWYTARAITLHVCWRKGVKGSITTGEVITVHAAMYIGGDETERPDPCMV
jgi:hypothetical protein